MSYQPVTVPAMNRDTCLIAEDDLVIAEMYQFRLEREGWRVRVASDGERALEMTIAELPTVLLLDMEMPKMAGIEVLRRLRSQPETSALPVVVISNLSDAQMKEDARRLGIVEWAAKSGTTPERLAGLIRTYLTA